MELKELIKKRIEENVAHYDIGVIESYEYLIEMITIEYHTQQSSITAVVQAKPEKVFDIHSCINEICYAANKDSCLFNDNINNHSFRFRIKKAIDKLMYTK
jgi:hypothetical protein